MKPIFRDISKMLLLLSTLSYGAINGVAFKDYNGDGIRQNGEPGVGDIVVKAYTNDLNNKDNFLQETTTRSDGSYSLDVPLDSYPLRLEFIIPDSSCYAKKGVDFPSAGANNYGSSIQFAKADGETHNFALEYPYDFSTQDNPYVFVPIMVNGDPLANGSAAEVAALAKFHFKASGIAKNSGRGTGSGEAWIEIAKQKQVGSIFGVAYSRQARRVFVSAFLKRHNGLGPLGSGGVYILNPDKTSTEQQNIEFLNLDELGYPTSDTTKPYTKALKNSNEVYFSSVVGSNQDRGLPADKTKPNADSAAYGQVGKLSLGDLEISDDGEYLYTVNLYDRKLYEIDLTNPKNPIAPTKDNASKKIKAFSIPNPCTYDKLAGEYRPFGLKYKDNKIYVGIVCSAQDYNGTTLTNDNSKMRGFIYSLDLNDHTTWSQLVGLLQVNMVFQ